MGARHRLCALITPEQLGRRAGREGRGEGSRTGGSALLPVQHTFTHVCAPLKPIPPAEKKSRAESWGSSNCCFQFTKKLAEEGGTAERQRDAEKGPDTPKQDTGSPLPSCGGSGAPSCTSCRALLPPPQGPGPLVHLRAKSKDWKWGGGCSREEGEAGETKS